MAGEPGNAACNPVCSRLDGVVGKVCITSSRLNLRVTKELSDHGEPLADEQAATGEGVTQVMDSHIVEPGARLDAPLQVLQVG